MSQSTEKQNAMSAFIRFSSTGWFAALLFGLLTVLVFGGFFFSDQMLHSSDQMAGLDSKVILKDALLTHHQFPWWEPSRLGGMPTIETLFFGEALYLPTLVMLLCTSVAKYISLKMIFHIFLAGLFFYLMLRKGFRMNQLVSITGGLFYMFNPQFFSHIYPGHDGKMFVIAWLPFIIWHLKNLMEHPDVFKMSLISIGIAMCIFSPQIQMTYFMLWGAFLYWVTATTLTWVTRKDTKKALAMSGYFWGAVVLGLGLGAMQIFPSMSYVNDGFSVRGAERGFEFAASWSLHWPEFFSLWIPELANSLDYYWGQNPFKLNSEYAGMLPVLLSIGAVALKPKKPWRIFWAAVAVGTALFALGAHTPVFHFAYAVVPGVKKFRAASMIMFWFSFSTIILSTLFLKDLATGAFDGFDEKRKKAVQKALLITAGCAVGLTLLFSLQGFVKSIFSEAVYAGGKERLFDMNFSKNFLPFLWLWLIFALASIALVSAVLNNKLKPGVAVSLLLVIGLIDVLRIDAGFIKLINPRPYFYRDSTIQQLNAEMKQAPFRCFSLPGALPRNGEGVVGLEGLGDFNDNELHWYRSFRGEQGRNLMSSLIVTGPDGNPSLDPRKLSEGNPFLNLANAKYLLVRNGAQLMTFENRNVLGRISFVAHDTIMDSAAVPAALAGGGYDYRTHVALTSEPNLPEGFSPLPADAPPVTHNLDVTWETYSPNYRKATFKSTHDGFLRIAEVFYPGWKVFIDGKETDYYRADLSWMAVPIKSGDHTFELRAHSAYLGKYVKFTIVSLLIIAGCCVWYGVRRRKPA